MMQKDWVIYYADDTEFSNLDGPPQSSPIKNVVCIGDRTYARTAWGGEWYFWSTDNNEWWDADTSGLLYQLCKDASKIIAVRKGALNIDPGGPMWKAFVERTSNV